MSWNNYWQLEHVVTDYSLEQSVGRILNGKPVESESWAKTVKKVEECLSLTNQSRLLDLCGGNGLFSTQISSRPALIVCADINDGLLRQMLRTDIPRIQLDCCYLPFRRSSFSSIVVYAGLQYLTESEVFRTLENLVLLLEPNGNLFLGDLPDSEKKLEYLFAGERSSRYFSSLRKGLPMIGTWFDREWIRAVLQEVGFSTVNVFDQEVWEPYANFRFDVKAEK